jgi:hypothetical protein
VKENRTTAVIAKPTSESRNLHFISSRLKYKVISNNIINILFN